MTQEPINLNACPVCDEDELEGGAFDTDGPLIWQRMWCNVCDSTWDDNYMFDSRDNIDNRLKEAT